MIVEAPWPQPTSATNAPRSSFPGHRRVMEPTPGPGTACEQLVAAREHAAAFSGGVLRWQRIAAGGRVVPEVAPGDYEGERQCLAGLGFEIHSGEHPFMPVDAFYLDDPDGNEVEIATWRG